MTVVELLVVIAILGGLAALLLPAIQAARESSRRAACQNNLRQIGLGIIQFEAVNRKYPAGKKWSGPSTKPDSFAMAWSSFLLGYLEQQAVHDSLDFKLPFTHPKNLPAASTVIPVYLCPSTSQWEDHRSSSDRLINMEGVPGEGLACIDYLGISGPDKDSKHPGTKLPYGRQRGVLIGTKGLPREEELLEPPPISSASIEDGLTNTFMVTECTGRGVSVDDGQIDALHGAWASGNNVTHTDGGINRGSPPKVWYSESIFSDHPQGANFLMCDGSVHLKTSNTPKSLVRWLASRDGEEDLSSFEEDDLNGE